MWIEAIFAKEDLERILERAMPMTIDIDAAGNHVTLREPKNVALIADRGLRVECAANVLWTVLGIHVPITLHSVTALLRPEIVKGPHGDALVFGLVIEHADFAGIPSVIDDHLTDKINAALEAEHLDLSWDFSETLSGSFALPASLRPLDALSLSVAWGKLRVTEEAFVMAISFHSEVTRHEADEAARSTPAPAIETAPSVEREAPTRTLARSTEAPLGAGIVALGATGIALGIVGLYGAFRLGARGARREGMGSWLHR
jgi:hypothetical protein